MPTNARSFPATAWEDTQCVLYALVQRDNAGTLAYLLQADLASIAWASYAVGSNTAAASGTFVIASTVFDTLQTGTAWLAMLGSLGGNFRAVLPETALPKGSTKYTVQVIFTLTGGKPFPLVFEVTTKTLRG